MRVGVRISLESSYNLNDWSDCKLSSGRPSSQTLYSCIDSVHTKKNQTKTAAQRETERNRLWKSCWESSRQIWSCPLHDANVFHHERWFKENKTNVKSWSSYYVLRILFCFVCFFVLRFDSCWKTAWLVVQSSVVGSNWWQAIAWLNRQTFDRRQSTGDGRPAMTVQFETSSQ